MTTPPVMSITDEQLAEIIEFADSTSAPGWDEVRGIKVATLRALITRLREAEADAKRYRHQFGSSDWWDYHHQWCGHPKEYVDSEIDAAMESTP